MQTQLHTKAKEVVSLTDHFTDMINAAVTVPDHPEALSYDPTSLKDIKAADPSAGINLIEAPLPRGSGANGEHDYERQPPKLSCAGMWATTASPA